MSLVLLVTSDGLVFNPLLNLGTILKDTFNLQDTGAGTVNTVTYTTPLNYEEGSEIVCGGVDMTHRTSDRTEQNSEMGIGFGVMDAHGHTTLTYLQVNSTFAQIH